MNKFGFLTKQKEVGPIFSGQVFYNVYKDAEFFRHSENFETLLYQGHELRNMLKGVKPGERVALDGMMLERNTPLFVTKTGPNINVENYEFTNNRLSGLVAAFAFDNRQRFPILSSTEAQLLGLTWDNQDKKKCRLFLSAVSGTEHFYEQFKYWPLVCALRKLQVNKITKEPVIKMKIIMDMIKKLHFIGLITCTVCDQGSSNVSALNYLVGKTKNEYIKNGHELRHHLFEVDDKKVAPLYETHLIKCIRNNLLFKNFKCTINNQEKSASWEHIQKLYDQNPGYKGIRILPKMTENHVMVQKMSKMKVKFATQVFSSF